MRVTANILPEYPMAYIVQLGLSMARSIICNRIRFDRYLILPMLFLHIASGLVVGDEFGRKLNELDKLRNGAQTPFDEVEAIGAKLLIEYPTESEQARTYSVLAGVYATTGQRHPQKTIDYCRKALALPLDPDKCLILYSYWGDAVQFAHRGVQGNELAAVRREAVVPYLEGLKFTLDRGVPESLGPRPTETPSITHAPNATPEVESLRARDAGIGERHAIWLQNRWLILLRGQLVDSVVYLYSRYPFDTEELKKLTHDYVGETFLEQQIVQKTEESIQKRTADSIDKNLDIDAAVELAMTPPVADTAQANQYSASIGPEVVSKSVARQAVVAHTDGNGNPFNQRLIASALLAAIALITLAWIRRHWLGSRGNK